MLVQMKIFNEMLDKMIKYEDSTLSATYILDLVDEINEMTIKLLMLNHRLILKKLEKGEIDV